MAKAFFHSDSHTLLMEQCLQSVITRPAHGQYIPLEGEQDSRQGLERKIKVSALQSVLPFDQVRILTIDFEQIEGYVSGLSMNCSPCTCSDSTIIGLPWWRQFNQQDRNISGWWQNLEILLQDIVGQALETRYSTLGLVFLGLRGVDSGIEQFVRDHRQGIGECERATGMQSCVRLDRFSTIRIR